MKRFIKAALTLMALCAALTAMALAAEPIAIYCDGVLVETEVPAQIIGGRTMVPLRAVTEMTGLDVSWRAADSYISITSGEEAAPVLDLQVGNTLTRVYSYDEAAGQYICAQETIDAPPVIVDGRTLVPLRYIAQSLDYLVTYDVNSANVPTTIYLTSRISTGSEELDAALDEIVADVTSPEMSLDDMLFAVYDWTGNNIKYRSTPIDLSAGYTPEIIISHTQNTLDTYRGACEHFALVTAGLFNRLGVKTILIQGARYSTYYGTWDEHSWVLAEYQGAWRHCDALYEHQHVGTVRGCFMKSDEQFAPHHTWNAEEYPVCP